MNVSWIILVSRLRLTHPLLGMPGHLCKSFKHVARWRAGNEAIDNQDLQRAEGRSWPLSPVQGLIRALLLQ